MAEPWRPWRAVAARVLWTYYRAAAATAKSSANRKVDGTEKPKRRSGRRAPVKVYAKPRR